MIKRAIIGMAFVALLPSQAAASAAVIAATSAATMAAASSSTSSSSDSQMPQGISASPVEWAEVGWLTCPRNLTEPQGCGADRDFWNGEALDVEPWIEWMKRHKGQHARFMGMTFIEGRVRLFYGVPQE